MKTFEQIAELEKQYLLGTYNRYPIALTRGKGVFLYDIDDRRYLDFVSGLGVNALGHAHPRIVKTIREQAAKLIHVSNLYYHEYQGELAEKLCTLLGSSFGNARAFFSNSGTEAIEGSIKLARLAGHRAGGEAKCRLVALQGSSHGARWTASKAATRPLPCSIRPLAPDHRPPSSPWKQERISLIASAALPH